MRVLLFFQEIFVKNPLLVIINIILLVVVGLFEAFAIITITPVVDYLIHPDLNGLSNFTNRILAIMKSIGMPVTLFSMMAIFLFFNIMRSIFLGLSKYSMARIQYKLIRDMMIGTFDDFLNAQWHFFRSSSQGTLTNTLMREVAMMGEAFGSMTLLLASVVQVIFYFAAPFYLTWEITSIGLISALIFAAPFFMLGKVSYRLGRDVTTTANHVGAIICENLSSSKVILGYGNQHISILRFADAFNLYCRAKVKSRILSDTIPIMYYPLGIFVLIITIFASKWFRVPLSETVAVLFSLQRVIPSLSIITSNKNSLENLFPSYEQVKNIRHRARELRQKTGNKLFIGFTREIIFDGVSFSYPGNKPVLIDINVEVPKGKMVAFVGESGAGKTSLIDIVMGFNEPSSGKVTFDGIPVGDFDINSLRQRIGYVPQESILFNMSVRDNLLWANENAGESEIREACGLANTDEFIKALPEGYDTVIGDRGVRLSGGQIQRIALARAILRKPELLILDEATSALDTKSERLIQQSIEAISKYMTVICIAHRLSTVMSADYIYVLNKGRIVEEGNYNELLTGNRSFAEMVRLQKL